MSTSYPGLEPEGNEPRKRRKAAVETKRITVVLPDEQMPQHPAVVQADRAVVPIPAPAHLLQMLTTVTDITSAKELHDLAGIAERYAKIYDDMFTSAEVRIRLEIHIGRLPQACANNQDARRLHSVTENAELPPKRPEWLSARMASRYRSMASVPNELVCAYFDSRRSDQKLPSSNGLLAFAGQLLHDVQPGRSSPRRNGQTLSSRFRQAEPVPASVIDAIGRCMQVNVAVGGDPKTFPKALCIKTDLLKESDLHGDVFIAECLEPASWLTKLVDLQPRQGIAQVAVVLPATTGAAWFICLEQGKWVCCFLRDTHLTVAYLGHKRRGFADAFHALGTIMLAGACMERTY